MSARDHCERRSMFTVLDDSNTAHVTLSDARPNNWHSRTVCTLDDTRDIANTILRYARERRAPLECINVSIIHAPEVQV